jgi:hypothetical protein
VLTAEACNTGPEPFIRYDNPALRRVRLAWVKQNYVRDDTLTAANAKLVSAQNRIAPAHVWGGGEVASADGMRFIVPIRTVHAGPNAGRQPHATTKITGDARSIIRCSPQISAEKTAFRLRFYRDKLGPIR